MKYVIWEKKTHQYISEMKIDLRGFNTRTWCTDGAFAKRFDTPEEAKAVIDDWEKNNPYYDIYMLNRCPSYSIEEESHAEDRTLHYHAYAAVHESASANYIKDERTGTERESLQCPNCGFHIQHY